MHHKRTRCIAKGVIREWPLEIKNIRKKIKNSPKALQYKFKEVSQRKDNEIEIMRGKKKESYIQG